MSYIAVFALGVIAAWALFTYWPTGWKWLVAVLSAGAAFAVSAWEQVFGYIGG